MAGPTIGGCSHFCACLSGLFESIPNAVRRWCTRDSSSEDHIGLLTNTVTNQSNSVGDLYTGEMRDGTYNGQGTLVFGDGGLLIGSFANGQLIRGRIVLEDGSQHSITKQQ